MNETTRIESAFINGELVYVVILYFKDTGEVILAWSCKKLKEAWGTSREVNRILGETCQ